MRKTLALLLTALMLLSAGCAQATSLMDMYGREVVLDAPATRIVALAPSDCEILCALGAEDLLVGRGAYCDYPESILDVPVVETGENTTLEQIIALQPQVVLMADMAQTAEQVQALEDAGIRVVLSDANDIEGVYTAIRMIGQLTGLEGEAEALVADMQATFDGIVAQSEETGKTVYFEVSPLEYGLWTAGANTFMDELASLCGLTNAFADVEGWAAISEEQVLERDPDYIVTISTYYGEGPTPVEEIMGRAGWEGLTAIQNGDVFNADSNEISRPGPRLKDAALALYAFVSGEAEEPAA